MTHHLTESAPSAWLRSLDNITGADMPLVGGKAFRLALLKRHGLTVPPGLVLTTAFFEAHLQYHHFIPLWAGSPDIAVTPEALNWLADALKLKPLSRELSRALNERLTADLSEADTFAVRSSAIDEDQRDYTFAGIHLTELGVPRSALPIAISRCWASALSKQAIEYRQSHGMSIQGIRIAVLIQPMLKPHCAGVGFTVNPLTGSREELIIEAAWGLGQAVVSSSVQPYFYKLANQPSAYPLLEQRSGSAPPPADETAATGPLAPAELAELAGQLEQIHALLGEAQDVEWARQNHTFFILQTRPVALPPNPAQTLDWVWTRGQYPETLPELPSPLFGSLLEHSQNRINNFLRDTGLSTAEPCTYIKLIMGRPYLNLTCLKRIISRLGLTPGSFLFTVGHVEPGSATAPLSVDWETAWQSRHIYGRLLKRMLGLSHVGQYYHTLVNETCAVFNTALPTDPPTTLLNPLRQQQRLYNELFVAELHLTSAIAAVTALGSSLIAPLTTSPATFISALALSGVKTAVAELDKALLKLSHLARQIPSVLSYLMLDNFDNYANTPSLPAEFRTHIAQLLAQYGQRAVYEADPGWPRYAETPAPLLRIIRQYAQSEHLNSQTAALNSGQAVSWQQLARQIIPWRRWLAAPLVGLLRRLLAQRETLHANRVKAVAASRNWNLALGQKWVEQGWLSRADDIFWLTLDEIERTLLVEENIGVMLPSIVQARQDTYRTYAATPLPYSLSESQIAAIHPGIGLSPEPSSEVMVGLPVSPGQARGRVVVLHSPADLTESASDIILVMPSTDPAWLPLLRLASGLIVEMGGLLSHGSVIAREYGLPAVANIPDATRRFNTGDTVLVDGSTGVVQLLEAASPSSPPNKNAG
jgi:rifampicin phosphotransferase